MNLQNKLIASFLLMSAAATAAFPQQRKASVLDISRDITDNAIVFPETYEADINKLIEGWYLKNYTSLGTGNNATTADVETTDAEIIKRLQALPAIIEMPFNKVVRQYIDKYTKNGRRQVAAILGLESFYGPIFRQALEAEGLPLELQYLPVIESGLDPNAVSRHGATGLWQFILNTAHGLGLEVNSLVDQRRDPYLSSRTAAKYLKQLYEAYGDWTLAIAAYNCGPTTVNKAIRRAPGDPKDRNFWKIYNLLPEETRGYVPMFIAANYVMNYYPKHGIAPVLPTKPLITDTIGISQRTHFNQISAILNIPIEELRMLNPQYRADIIPATAEKQYMLTLPSQQIHAYLLSEDAIHNFEADKYARDAVVEPSNATSLTADNHAATTDELAELKAMGTQSSAADKTGAGTTTPVTITHKVVAGETLSSIANQYGVTEREIKNWNNLRRNAIRVGQQLRITTSNPENEDIVQTAQASTTKQNAAPAKSKKKSNAAKAKPRTTNHKIKSGESLSTIARKYGVTVNDLKRANGMTSDNIRAGKTLKIPAKSSKNKKRRRR